MVHVHITEFFISSLSFTEVFSSSNAYGSRDEVCDNQVKQQGMQRKHNTEMILNIHSGYM